MSRTRPTLPSSAISAERRSASVSSSIGMSMRRAPVLVGRRAEIALPELIAEHDDAGRAGAILVRGERAARERSGAEDLEHAGRDALGVQAARFPEPAQDRPPAVAHRAHRIENAA